MEVACRSRLNRHAHCTVCLNLLVDKFDLKVDRLVCVQEAVMCCILLRERYSAAATILGLFTATRVSRGVVCVLVRPRSEDVAVFSMETMDR